MPELIAVVLALLEILLAYASHLTATLEYRAAARGFSTLAQFFGTARLPVILGRLARGILRIQALRRVLLARAERGRDLVPLQPRKRAEPRPQPQQPPPSPQAPDSQPEPPLPRRTNRRSDADDAPDPANLPTLEQMEAEIRRRPIGQAIAAICRDLGISPRLCEGNFWTRLYQAIDWHGGNFGKYYQAIRRREVDFEPEMIADPNLGLPEQTREGVRRMLGFFIGGEPPATPFWVCVPAGAYQAAARPP